MRPPEQIWSAFFGGVTEETATRVAAAEPIRVRPAAAPKQPTRRTTHRSAPYLAVHSGGKQPK